MLHMSFTLLSFISLATGAAKEKLKLFFLCQEFNPCRPNFFKKNMKVQDNLISMCLVHICKSHDE